MDNEIVTLGYEMVMSLGKYRSHLTTKTPLESSCSYYIEVVSEPETIYRDTRYHGKVYYYKQERDLDLKGWTFSPIFECNIHSSASYFQVDFNFNCQTPQHSLYEFNLCLGSMCNMSLAELYMELISITSLCKNTDELQAIMALYKANTYSNKGEGYLKLIVQVEEMMKQAESNSSRHDFCDYCKQLIAKSKEKLQ